MNQHLVEERLTRHGWTVRGESLEFRWNGEAVMSIPRVDRLSRPTLQANALGARSTALRHYCRSFSDGRVDILIARLLASCSLVDVASEQHDDRARCARVVMDIEFIDGFPADPASPQSFHVLAPHPASLGAGLEAWLRSPAAKPFSSALARLEAPERIDRPMCRELLNATRWTSFSGGVFDSTGRWPRLDLDCDSRRLEEQLDLFLSLARAHRRCFKQFDDQRASVQWAYDHSSLLSAVAALYASGAVGNGLGIARSDLSGVTSGVAAIISEDGLSDDRSSTFDDDLAGTLDRHIASLSDCVSIESLSQWCARWRHLQRAADVAWMAGRGSRVSSSSWMLHSERVATVNVGDDDPVVVTPEFAAELVRMGWQGLSDGSVASPGGLVVWQPGEAIASSWRELYEDSIDRLRRSLQTWQARHVVWGSDYWCSDWLLRWSLVAASGVLQGIAEHDSIASAIPTVLDALSESHTLA